VRKSFWILSFERNKQLIGAIDSGALLLSTRWGFEGKERQVIRHGKSSSGSPKRNWFGNPFVQEGNIATAAQCLSGDISRRLGY